jgi:hypothetical protein
MANLHLLSKAVEPCLNCYEPGSVATRGHLHECMEESTRSFWQSARVRVSMNLVDVVLDQINSD